MSTGALSTAQPMAPVPLRVRSLRRESADTFTVSLDVSGRPGGFPFQPGQFNMLYALGVGEVPISISGDPGRPGELLHTIRVVGSVTEALRRVGRGGWMGVRGPYGRPWPLEEARGLDVVVVAGGLGLAPLRSVILHLLRHREAYGRVSLLVGARSPEGLLYRRELARWGKDPRLKVLITVDQAGPEWKEHVGVVPALLRDMALDASRTVALMCGPEVMMRFTVRELERLGVPDTRIHLSLERNMKCAVGFCGHCQLVPFFVCKDGPVLPYDRLRPFLHVREV
ncbi:Ni/Fe hydrogenase subunit gamma [Cystobacter fuscus]|uniref:Ni/Fe hydrogenase subunit gamma n=1 Tax=Cystobacter fuscus TaxID=43 RepID=A0A250IVB9_9BACT|nr:FAD/NAD(P)-binding protein [Cystobacter fuscus]ATB35193.1 Ni/Fe hydrogenase subunit gamma [Cystobacter fuscus]